jgi:hypothetical protein
VPERERGWLGRLLIPGPFDGEHYFQLEQRNATCSGILLPLFGDGLLQATRQGSVAMKTALKNRAEAGQSDRLLLKLSVQLCAQRFDLVRRHRRRRVPPGIANKGRDCCDFVVGELPIVGRHRKRGRTRLGGYTDLPLSLRTTGDTRLSMCE